MDKGTLLVVGASGDVGRGIVQAALQSGRNVIAAGREAAKLATLDSQEGAGRLARITGDIASEGGAERLWTAARDAFGGVTDVVVSVNAPNCVRPLLDLTSNELGELFAGNVLTHFVAARTFLRRLPATGMLIGIGGGTADFIFPKMAPVSMGQAALRMLYRGLAKERQSGAQLRELMIVSMVAGQSNRDTAQPDWVTDLDVGRHVCAILDQPDRFPKPVLRLLSRKQVGHPEPETAN
jgi:NAD(P)-dependent dehydrogenase (short-subunit alcohol dehydrogenase family)